MVDLDVTSLHRLAGALSGFAATVDSNAYLPHLMTWAYDEMNEAFGDFADNVAASTDTIDHMYEWSMPYEQGRLWRGRLEGRSANRQVAFDYLPSKTYVPVPEELTEPGKTGRSVRTDSHIFVNKAMVMEMGLSVTIRPKGDNYLAFLPTPVQIDKDGYPKIIFTNRSVTMVPGREVSGNFTLLFASWWTSQAPEVFKTRVAPLAQRDLVQEIQRELRKKSKSMSFSVAANDRERRMAAAAMKRNIRKLGKEYERRGRRG